MREKTGDLGSLALVEPAPTHGSEAPNWFPLAGSEKPEQVVVKTEGYLGNVGLRVSRRGGRDAGVCPYRAISVPISGGSSRERPTARRSWLSMRRWTP
jgi:hypothetical protein